jgi:hypothetical protein
MPLNAPRDGVHQTWLNRSNLNDQALYKRVATKLGVTRDHVREVALGKRHSASVLAALKEEREQIHRSKDGVA